MTVDEKSRWRKVAVMAVVSPSVRSHCDYFVHSWCDQIWRCVTFVTILHHVGWPYFYSNPIRPYLVGCFFCRQSSEPASGRVIIFYAVLNWLGRIGCIFFSFSCMPDSDWYPSLGWIIWFWPKETYIYHYILLHVVFEFKFWTELIDHVFRT